MKNNQMKTCLWFDDHARAAAEFYCTVFKNSTIDSENPVVVGFELNGTKVIALNGGPMFKINPSISLSVISGDMEEVNDIWDKLIEGGKAMMPIDKYPWSERYGWLQDRFGMTWQISIARDRNADQKITPCLLFVNKLFGKAEEAINFYSSIFEKSNVTTLIHYPKGDENEGKVMYSEFKLGNNELIAMDGPGDHKYNFNEAVSLVVDCNTQKEIDYFWDKLTEGGEESMCGWVKDKFGLSWQIVPAKIGTWMMDPEKGGRVMKEILKMRKLDILTLENA
jgi:predicted 3-demethylubiquinone-9 3-methyltransferase (glyoxalase superfamily)